MTPLAERSSIVPVPPGVEYHRVLAGDRPRVARGILAIVLLVGGMFAMNIGLSLATAMVDRQMGFSPPTLGGTDHTPLFHFTNLVSIALLIPWSMCLQRWLYGVRGASLHSVISRFRFELLGRALVLIGPLWLGVSLLVLSFQPLDQAAQSTGYLLTILAITLVTAPLQGAGEEYGYRGLVFRVASSWNRGPRTALVVGVSVSSLVFMLVHNSPDPWFNLWTFSLAVSMAIVTWRTGGIEVACVVHALNNTLTYVLLLVVHAELGVAVERSGGSGLVIMVVPCVVLVAITAVVWLRTRRTGPALTPVSGAARTVRSRMELRAEGDSPTWS